MTNRPAPKFTGVDTYADSKGRYTIRFATDWHKFDLDHGLEGVLFSPHPTNTNTYVAIWCQALDVQAEARDADDIAKAFDEGLGQLNQYTLLEGDNVVIGNLIKLERFYTFEENGIIRKRKVWAMYVGKWLMVLTYQGETVEEWDHWYAMANQSFFHFVIPPELWFAMDRDLSIKGTPTTRVARGKPKKS